MYSSNMPSWNHLFEQIGFKVGGTISCIGSAYIIQDVLRHPDKRSISIYHRVMVGLSIMDIFFSFFTFFLGSWPLPKGSSYLWAAGNMAFCDIAAIIGLVGFLGVPLYNCSLASFYSLQLKYSWTDHRLRSIEKLFHIVPCSIAVLFSIIAYSTKTLGPSIGFCGPTMGYPLHCDEPEIEVECIRGGSKMNNVLFIVGALIPLICIIFVSITMFRVYRTVREAEVNAEKYNFLAKFRGSDKKKSRKMSRRVMIQGIAYSAVMIILWLLIFIEITIYYVTNHHGNEVSHYVGIIFVLFNPLQGAFNALIYLIPFFRKLLKDRRQKIKEKDMLKDKKDDNEESIEAILTGEGKEEEKVEERREFPSPLQVKIGSEINNVEKENAKIVNILGGQNSCINSFDSDDYGSYNDYY